MGQIRRCLGFVCRWLALFVEGFYFILFFFFFFFCGGGAMQFLFENLHFLWPITCIFFRCWLAFSVADNLHWLIISRESVRVSVKTNEQKSSLYKWGKSADALRLFIDDLHFLSKYSVFFFLGNAIFVWKLAFSLADNLHIF